MTQMIKIIWLDYFLKNKTSKLSPESNYLVKPKLGPGFNFILTKLKNPEEFWVKALGNDDNGHHSWYNCWNGLCYFDKNEQGYCFRMHFQKTETGYETESFRESDKEAIIRILKKEIEKYKEYLND